MLIYILKIKLEIIKMIPTIYFKILLTLLLQNRYFKILLTFFLKTDNFVYWYKSMKCVYMLCLKKIT